MRAATADGERARYLGGRRMHDSEMRDVRHSDSRLAALRSGARVLLPPFSFVFC
ncbi:hypothetical protein ES319_A08G202000v1 [Gossypium barbadense]|uniref:Uncharacterized protein n=1 Tax=Gossypium barbadense TaxID=3634 RepID=A0A5J5UUR3_GOSBA|nr:hypothetical protein ES319_A08G202000v1 [Gossypium barbadense]